MILYTKPSTTLRTLSQQNNKSSKKTAALVKHAAAAVLLCCMTFFTSCIEQKTKPLVIWTDNAEFASYAELFNATHDIKAVVVYKEEPARALPPAKDEPVPDLVIASWIKNASTKKNFLPISYLFGEHKISRTDFYEKLLAYGEINNTQYLLPVSFNLPAMAFSKKNEDFIQGDHTLSLSSLKDSAAEFNKKTDNGSFIAMGYAPSWDKEFIYQVSKLYGADYAETGSTFSWNAQALQSSVEMLRGWTEQHNADTVTEQNFQFKYLYMPSYQQISSGHCLFAYMSSHDFFALNSGAEENLSFRWLTENGRIMIEDNITMLGMYRHAKNPQRAEFFIEWLLQEDTQNSLLDRMRNMKLDTVSFGIAGGFSSLKNVNTQIFPSYYHELLGNLPSEEYMTVPNTLPDRWQIFKSKVILPYLSESTDTAKVFFPSLEERLSAWNRQSF